LKIHNLPLKKKIIFFWIKNYNLPIPGPPLHKGRPSYNRSLQLSKENIQNFKTWHLNFFLLLWVILALPDPESEYGSGSTDPIESGSNSDPDPQPCIFWTCLRIGNQNIKNKIKIIKFFCISVWYLKLLWYCMSFFKNYLHKKRTV
jgi:hypothetical protein